MQDVEMIKELMASLREAMGLAGNVLPTRNYMEVLEKAEKVIAEEKLYVGAVEAWGALSQLEMTIEECSELIKAIQKFKRAKPGMGRLATAHIDAMAEEVADVEIMCAQMCLLVGEDRVREIKTVKLHRLREMLRKDKEGAE